MSQSDKSAPPPRVLSDTSTDSASWAIQHPLRDLTGLTLGDYQVERLIGRGGMGEVYLARQTSLNRPVALKVLRPELLTKEKYLTRFEAEATAVAKLNHPNIVHIYALALEDGVRFIAMEYVPGTNLREYVLKKGALEYPLALSLMKQAVVAVGVAGELGLIHRDLKPENLLLTKKGQVKIADFGLCRDLAAGPLDLTQPGVAMGTPAYMSPEQAQGLAVDHRSDLYSLGATFYYMLTGENPFKGDSAIAVALKHLREVAVRPKIIRDDMPVELDRLVMKLLEKSPAKRYQSASEVLRDLSRIREAMHAPTGLQPMYDVPGVSGTSPRPEAISARTEPLRSASLEATRVDNRATKPRGPIPFSLKVAALAMAMGLGGVLGWVQRPADLLSAGEPSPTGKARTTPGLWIDPRWAQVPRAPTAEAQFHYAQIQAPADTREAAWLAVAGQWPNSKVWVARSYAQLARDLLTRNNPDRLRAFASEIDRWEGGQTHEKELADLIRAGACALDDDLDGVIEFFKNKASPDNLTDPALLELGLKVTDEAEDVANRPGAPANLKLARESIQKIRQSLLAKLIQTERPDAAARRTAKRLIGPPVKRAAP